MEHSPHLKKAMVEIKEVLDKYDIAGIVAIHAPGFSEYLVKIDPSYSCAKPVEGGIRIRAKVSDFQGDLGKRDLKLAATSNMFNLLTQTIAVVTLPLMETSKELDEKLGAVHTDMGQTTEIGKDN